MPIHNQIQLLSIHDQSKNNWVNKYNVFSLLIKARAYAAAGPTLMSGSEVRSYGARYFALPFVIDDFDKLNYYWQNNSIQLSESAQDLLKTQADIETANGQFTYYEFEGFFYHFGQYKGKEIFLANGQKSSIEWFHYAIDVHTRFFCQNLPLLSHIITGPAEEVEELEKIVTCKCFKFFKRKNRIRSLFERIIWSPVRFFVNLLFNR
jgi:hypothetical protein